MSTVAVVGLGDLGSRVLDTLARAPRIERLIGATRNREHGEARVAQCRLVAALQGGPRHLEFKPIDEIADAATLDADVIVCGATRHTWWKPSPDGVAYGTWLPLQLTLVRDLMRAGPRAPPRSRSRVAPTSRSIRGERASTSRTREPRSPRPATATVVTATPQVRRRRRRASCR